MSQGKKGLAGLMSKLVDTSELEETEVAALEVKNKETLAQQWDMLEQEESPDHQKHVSIDFNNPGEEYALEDEPVRVRRNIQDIGQEVHRDFIQELGWVPCTSKIGREVPKKHRRKKWCSSALILLRDEGMCRLCGEGVRGNTWSIKKLDRELGWEEENCYLMCSQCGLVFVNREFAGSAKEQMQQIRLMVLNKRRKGAKGSKPLSEFAFYVLKKLRGAEDIRVNVNRSVTDALKSMPRRFKGYV